MSDNQFNSPFLVNELRPQNVHGGGGKFYQLSAASASPTRIIGRDRLGRPIEDTIPTVFWRQFVMLDGCVNKVPMRTCSEFKMDPEATQYEQQITTDLITAGCMPLDVCPYTFKFSFITNGALVGGADGHKDCGGAPDGCSHMKEIMAERKAKALEEHKISEANFQSLRPDQVADMQARFAEGVGEAIARHLDRPQAPSAAAKRMQNHKSDQE